MLPFPILNQYGNEVEVPVVKFTTSEYSSTYSILKNGVLYLSGDNSMYQMGDGTTTNKYNTWIKRTETEEIIACSTGYRQTVYVTKTGRVMLTGTDITVNPNVVRTSWYNITSVLASSIDTSAIKYISIDRYGLLVILTDGTVWGTGTDSTGWMGTGSVPSTFLSMRQIHPGPAVACTAGTGVARIVLQDGTILGSGNNTSYQIDSTGVNISTFTNSFPTVDPSTIYQFKLGNNNCIVFLNNGTFHSTGMGSYGALGNNNTAISGNNQYYTGTLSFTPADMRQYRHLQGSSASAWSLVLSSSNEMYGCGYQGGNLISNTVSYGVFTKCVQTSTYPNMMFLSGSGNTVLINPYLVPATSVQLIASSPKATSPYAQSLTPALGISTAVTVTLPT